MKTGFSIFFGGEADFTTTTIPYATRIRVHIKYINRADDSLFDTARPCVIQGLVGVRQHQVPTRCIPC